MRNRILIVLFTLLLIGDLVIRFLPTGGTPGDFSFPGGSGFTAPEGFSRSDSGSGYGSGSEDPTRQGGFSFSGGSAPEGFTMPEGDSGSGSGDGSDTGTGFSFPGGEGGFSFPGTVTAISRTGSNEGGNTKFSVTVELPRQQNLLAGMNASVKITTAQTEAAAAIPVNALVEDGSRTYVYTSYDEKTDTLGGLTEVETGISDGTLVEILSGLEAGSTVWYRYADAMTYPFFSR